MEKTKILCVADGGITVKMMEELRALEPFGAEITIVEDKDMYAMGPITDRMTLIEHEGIDAAPTCQALLDNCEDKDILVVHVASINKEVIEKTKNLKVAAVLRGGYENADVPRLTEKGVKLINAPWRSANAVADFTVGMMIAENKNIARSHHLIMEGKWCKKYDNQSYIHDMRKMTIGIIGYGYIGQRVRMRLQGFESRVIVHDPYADPKKFADQNVEFVSLDELLKQSDIVTLHCPLTENTQNLINKETLSLFKRGALLINTGRGPLVNELDLLEALQSGQLGGAALDVLVKEPPPKDHPLIIAAQTMPNLIITPHVAWASDSAITTMVNKVRSNIEEFYQTGK